jgi:AraC family transcriptional regulator
MPPESPQLKLNDSIEIPSRQARSWRGFSVEHVTPAKGDRFKYSWQSDLHFCALHDIVLRDGGIRAGDGREIHQKDLRGSLTYVPKGAAVEGWSELAQRRSSYTAIYFDPSLLHEELEERFPEDWEPKVYFRNPEVAATLQRFTRLLTEDEADDLFSETLGLMTVLSLHRAAAEPVVQKLAISRFALSRVIDYIDQNLARQISLSDLAAVAGLSRFHFNRAFKKALGQTPYQYVLDRRIERGRRLLAEHALSLEQVAVAVGFREAAHFQKAFKAREGITPMTFRRNA